MLKKSSVKWKKVMSHRNANQWSIVQGKIPPLQRREEEITCGGSESAEQAEGRDPRGPLFSLT